MPEPKLSPSSEASEAQSIAPARRRRYTDEPELSVSISHSYLKQCSDDFRI